MRDRVAHMADPPSYPDSNSGTGNDTPRGPEQDTPRIPCWVKVFGTVVVLLLIVSPAIFNG